MRNVQVNQGATRLSEAAELNPGKSQRLVGETRVVFLPMAGANENGTLERPLQFRTFGQVSQGYTPFESSDILVAKITPCFQNGKIVDAAAIGTVRGFGSTEFHVIRPKPALIARRYLFHFLRQPWVRTAGERRMTGSAGQRRVPEAFLANLEIPLPSLSEQQRIAAVLDHVESLRFQHCDAIAKLDELGDVLQHRAFRGEL